MLEALNLADPTESRYAVIAQAMTDTGDWLTPILPSPEGPIVYSGKPPLHFWLTAASYRVFGVDEWTSRLPSFVGLAVTVAALVSLSRRLWDDARTGLLAGLILSSSGLFFIFSGASVLDVTLTAWVTTAAAAVVATTAGRREGTGTRRGTGADQGSGAHEGTADLVFHAALAAGFLVKGPVALVLAAVPCFVLSRVGPRPTGGGSVLTGRGVILFAAVVVPWFVAAEVKNPGALVYFLWNENIGRYLSNDYGDLYGSGHKHARGTALWMAATAFLPWTFLAATIAGPAYSLRFVRRALREDPGFVFALALAGTAPLFFCFARQLHTGYVVPAVPGMALAAARLVSASQLSASQLSASRAGAAAEHPGPRGAAPRLMGYPLAAAVGLALGGAVTGSCGALVPLLVAASAEVALYLFRTARGHGPEVLAASVAASWCVLLAAATGAGAGLFNRVTSSEAVLRAFVDASRSAPGGDGAVPRPAPVISVIGRHAYSNVWEAAAWKKELGAPLVVRMLGDYPEKPFERPVPISGHLRTGETRKNPQCSQLRFRFLRISPSRIRPDLGPGPLERFFRTVSQSRIGPDREAGRSPRARDGQTETRAVLRLALRPRPLPRGVDTSPAPLLARRC